MSANVNLDFVWRLSRRDSLCSTGSPRADLCPFTRKIPRPRHRASLMSRFGKNIMENNKKKKTASRGERERERARFSSDEINVHAKDAYRLRAGFTFAPSNNKFSIRVVQRARHEAEIFRGKFSGRFSSGAKCPDVSEYQFFPSKYRATRAILIVFMSGERYDGGRPRALNPFLDMPRAYCQSRRNVL